MYISLEASLVVQAMTTKLDSSLLFSHTKLDATVKYYPSFITKMAGKIVCPFKRGLTVHTMLFVPYFY